MEKDDKGYLKVNKWGLEVFSLKIIEMIFIFFNLINIGLNLY